MASVIPPLLAEFTHEDFSVKYLGLETSGITELSVDESEEFEFNYGNSPHPVSYSQLRGVQATGKIEMLFSTYLTFVQGLGGKRITSVTPSDLVQSFEIEGLPQKVNFVYKNFKLTKKSRGSKSGDKTQKVAFDFVCSHIEEMLES